MRLSPLDLQWVMNAELLPTAEIHKFLPGLHVELREESPSCLIELLLKGEVNVALVGDLDDTPERIDNWALFEERYVAVLVTSHELADRPAIGMEALREATILDRFNCDVAPNFTVSAFPTCRCITIIAAAGTCTCGIWRPRGPE